MRLYHLAALFLASATAAAATPGKNFDRVVFVVFENTDYSAAMAQPFFKSLANQGANFSQFEAMAHPSQGNYVALTSGDLNGVDGDGNYDLDVENVVDLLEAKGLTWKVYAENYPGHCFTGRYSGDYARKHNPFISYVNIQKNPARCAQIVEAQAFDQDAKNGTLPNYAFYVPNLKNDGHDTGVAYANGWYARKFGPYVADAHFMNRMILVTTFDESGSLWQNQIYTSIVGSTVKPGDYPAPYITPSLLRMVEDNWDLGNLGKQDGTAPLITGIWK